MRLKGKVAIITGGGRGIGEATCLKFAEEGAKVVVADMAGAEQVAEAIKAKGGEALAVTVDVTNPESVDKMIADTVAAFGKLDCIVNNAGITADAQLLKMTDEQWEKVIAVNLKGVYLCGKAAAKQMATQETGGVILNASSVVGVYGNFGQTNYAATKWGVIGMTKTWAKELGKKKIRTAAVCPGFINTPMVAKMPENVIDMMKGKSPLNRLGEPSEVANLYAFLASDEAAFITGAAISIDGGVVL
ncbi:MAG: 3-oxoacyl-ACP reductase FabG [Peptococcia bacterium]